MQDWLGTSLQTKVSMPVLDFGDFVLEGKLPLCMCV